METKKTKKFLYEGLGFPIILLNVTLVKKRGIWTPAIDYTKLQKEVVLALSHKPLALTGNEIHFIRTYFEMTLEHFGKQFGVTHAAVLNWEKAGDRPAKLNPTTELYVRLLILEKLNINNQLFREVFREFDIEKMARSYRSSPRLQKPVTLLGTQFSRRPYARV